MKTTLRCVLCWRFGSGNDMFHNQPTQLMAMRLTPVVCPACRDEWEAHTKADVATETDLASEQFIVQRGMEVAHAG